MHSTRESENLDKQSNEQPGSNSGLTESTARSDLLSCEKYKRDDKRDEPEQEYISAIYSYNWASGKKIECKSVAEAIQAIQSNQEITYLCFRDINISQQDMKSLVDELANNKSITSLNLGNSNLDDISLGYLSEMLKKNTHLRELSIHRNKNFTPKAVDEFASALKQNSTLMILEMWDCKLNDESIKIIAKNLIGHKSLGSLDISFNAFEDDTAKLFKSLLQEKSALAILKMDGNPNISKQMAKEIYDAAMQKSEIVEFYVNYKGIKNNLKKVDEVYNKICNKTYEGLDGSLISSLENAMKIKSIGLFAEYSSTALPLFDSLLKFALDFLNSTIQNISQVVATNMGFVENVTSQSRENINSSSEKQRS